MTKPKLAFYNPYNRKPYTTRDYWLERDTNDRARAVTNKDGILLYRYVSESFYRRHS